MSGTHECCAATSTTFWPSWRWRGSGASPARRRGSGCPVGAQPHRPGAGGTAGAPAPHPHHPQRGDDRRWRAADGCDRPRLDEIEAELAALSALREKPAGTIRITAGERAAESLLWPAVSQLLPVYPDIRVEIAVEYGLTDIVAGRYDAGVRLSEQVAKDMIAVRIGPEMRMAVVGAPGYFATRPRPRTPQDLTQHNCINLRLPTHGGLYAWEFEKDARELRVRVEGQFVVNTSPMVARAAEAGLGLACLPDDIVGTAVAAGRPVRVLED